jgi:hypothetical protein
VLQQLVLLQVLELLLELLLELPQEQLRWCRGCEWWCPNNRRKRWLLRMQEQVHNRSS